MPSVVLYQPQIPPNTGNVGRTCAATGTPLHLIEPLGFSLSDRELKRAGLDYWPLIDLHRHPCWESFCSLRERQGGRLIALSSHAAQPYTSVDFQPDDWLLFGRESDGLPACIHASADMRLVIPMRHASRHQSPGVRSLNLSVSVAVVLFEALRQIDCKSR
ncbi:MAG: tRNA (cytidine(34)-2'-O)-methyltransferase [Cyanobacteria bacterium M_surface_7_m2_040]|nr:tRNA (cytidine(34)-2'-O)-methyltransferase [Cyanobacteria bacterium K_Offshore_0m_m2_072]MBM5828164.1 tRNA (cytidine(34)-2'-O)-methyltransferase [Cyanobacteria bacterium M_surface_7_m2_040]